jgi:hypothetical protein
MNSKYILLICCIFSSYCKAQVKFEKEVELGNQLMSCNEPAITINPSNTRQQIVATNTKHVFRSKNNGRKYKHARAESQYGVYGDPVLMYDEKGNCFYVHLSEDKTRKWPESFDRIVVQKSTNNGRTWNQGVGIGKNGKMQDKAWISFDNGFESPYKGKIYITWTQFDKYESKDSKDSSRILFAYSADRAESFSTPVIISDFGGDCRDSDSTLEGATTSTGPKGEVYALWAGHQQLYFDVSYDGGKTWGKDKSILKTPKGWDLDTPDFMRTNGLPFLVSNREGKLMACTAYEIDGYNRVVVIESNDGGKNWSLPEVLQKDDSSHYIMPHAFVDKTSGTFAVIYYKIKNKQINVLLSYKKKDEKSFHTIRLNDHACIVPGNGVFFGDYINVCIVNDIIAATWTETKGISTVVKSRRVRLK